MPEKKASDFDLPLKFPPVKGEEAIWEHQPVQPFARGGSGIQFEEMWERIPEIGESLAGLARALHSRVADSMRLAQLERRIQNLENTACGNSKTVPINTFAPEPYEILGRIEVVIEPMGEEFMATFFDANISAAGQTEQEAFNYLKLAILDTFDSLSEATADELGPEPLRQRALLNHLIRNQRNHGDTE